MTAVLSAADRCYGVSMYAVPWLFLSSGYTVQGLVLVLWLLWGISLLSSCGWAAETRVCLGVSIGREQSCDPAGEHGLWCWAGVLWREGVPPHCMCASPFQASDPRLHSFALVKRRVATWVSSISVVWGSPLFGGYWGGLLLCSFPTEVPQCAVLLSGGFCSSLSNLQS